MTQPRVVAAGLAVGHGRRRVLEGLDLALRPGVVTVLVGPNGCGKSTLLHTLAGLQDPLAGTLTVDGDPVGGLSRRELARRLALLPQTPLVPAGVTVGELVRHGRYAHRGAFRRHTAADREAVAWAMAVTGAESLADARLDELSGGERQRGWLATVLAQRADVLLLDEPTTYLDLRHQFEVLDVVRRLAHTHGIAVGVVLHDLTQAAASGDEVVVVADGGIAAAGPPSDVLVPDVVERACGSGVDVLHDPYTGHLACFPRRSPSAEPAAVRPLEIR